MKEVSVPLDKFTFLQLHKDKIVPGLRFQKTLQSKIKHNVVEILCTQVLEIISAVCQHTNAFSL